MIERILHFLKSFPSQFLLSALFLIVLWMYLRTNDAFLQRVIDTLLGGLLGVVTGRALSSATQSANTTTGDIVVSQPEDLSKVTDSEIDKSVEKLEEKR